MESVSRRETGSLKPDIYENRFDILAHIPRPLKLVLQELRRFGVLVYLEDFHSRNCSKVLTISLNV
jgi:hypothetical protein